EQEPYFQRALLYPRSSAFIPRNPRPRLILSVRGPAAVDRNNRPGRRSGRFARKIHRKRRHLVDRNELLGRLSSQQHVAYDLLVADAAGLGRIGNLLLDQRRQYVTRTHCIGRYAVLGALESEGFRQPGHAVLGSDVGALERRSDQRVRRGDVDDAAELARL